MDSNSTQQLLNHFFPGLEICSKMEEFNKMDEIYFSLAKGRRKDLEAVGCLYPCSYTQYTVASEDLIDMYGFYGFGLSFASVATTVRREVYIYSTLSFISDLGGSLGLFLGFSFFGLWDLFQILLVKLTSRRCKS